MISTAVIVLVVAGVVLTFGLILMEEILETTSDTSERYINSTLETVDEGGEYVNISGYVGLHSFGIEHCYNATANDSHGIHPDGVWSVNSKGGKIYYGGSATETGFNNTDINCTGDFKWGSNVPAGKANETIGGQAKFADYIDLIALAVVITVIISLLIVVFAMRRVE